MEFKKNTLLAIVLSVCGIFISTLSFIFIIVADKMNGSGTGSFSLSLVTLVLFVLFLSALSVKKAVFAKIISFITIGCLLLASFILSIVTSSIFLTKDVSWDTVTFLAISILSLVAMVLFLIYCIVGRNGTLKMIAKVTNIASLTLYGLLTISLILSAFFGFFVNQPFYGFEWALIALTGALLLGLLFVLQNIIGPREENK